MRTLEYLIYNHLLSNSMPAVYSVLICLVFVLVSSMSWHCWSFSWCVLKILSINMLFSFLTTCFHVSDFPSGVTFFLPEIYLSEFPLVSVCAQ